MPESRSLAALALVPKPGTRINLKELITGVPPGLGLAIRGINNFGNMFGFAADRFQIHDYFLLERINDEGK